MDYIGSKEKINHWIFSKILLQYPNTNLKFLDACSGSGSVSRYAARLGFNVISNDIMMFPSCIANGSIGIDGYVSTQAPSIIKDMNKLDGIEGFFYKNYSESAGRLYFSDDNAKKIDAIRYFIGSLSDGDVKLRDYLLYCSLEALSRASNTAGVQAAFLKKLKERALKPIELRLETVIDGKITSYCSDILTLLRSEKFREKYKEDILYIDPPYNQRQYGPNYHLYETFVRYDSPTIHGKTGLRNWTGENKSAFCSSSGCLLFTKQIVGATTAKTIFISYSSDGIISVDELSDSLLSSGLCSGVSIHSILQKRYKSDSSDGREYDKSILKEYLIEISK